MVQEGGAGDADTDSTRVEKPAKVVLKEKAIEGMTKYIKNKISSDPEVGKVLETKDIVLNDTLYFAKIRILWRNKFGGNQQSSDIRVCACEKSGEYYMGVWTSDFDFSQHLLDVYHYSEDNSDDIIHAQVPHNDYTTLYNDIAGEAFYLIENIVRAM